MQVVFSRNGAHMQCFRPATLTKRKHSYVPQCQLECLSEINPAWAFKVRSLPLCQLDYLFNQRVTWLQAVSGEGGRQMPGLFILFFPCQLTQW